MKAENRRNSIIPNAGRQTIFVFAVLIVLVVIGVAMFQRYYGKYNEEILYKERLNQMKQVTEQLFSGLEDIVDVQWNNANYQRNYLKANLPATVDELTDIMHKQATFWEMDKNQSDIVAIDSQGRYYTAEGRQGLMSDMSYLDKRPEKLSYVFNGMTSYNSQMLFLYRMDEPIALQDSDKTVQIIYYGITKDMEQLNPYFNCAAYEGNNSIYVADENGLRLFAGKNSKNLLAGFNVFSELRNMKYLHDSSFDDTLDAMQETGLAYSNAILDDEEYYYSLYQMDNAEWVLLFLVPSRYVAINTVVLVDNTKRMLMLFAVFMTIVCVAAIYVVQHIQQRNALRIVNAANDKLEDTNEKLRQAQITTTKALHAAESASKAKTEFLANMSHDIRTPMNVIVGITKLMAHDKDDTVKMDSYIGKIQQSSQHLLSLINDVLDMSKIEASEVSLNKEHINLADQIWQIESIIRPQFEERGQKFESHTKNILHEHIIGDAVRLRQVFINLLSNAIKYTPYGGRISLELEELPSETSDYAKYRISVTDTGCGMSQEFIRHIFEPFTRAENSTVNRVQGTGLGMAITKNIVDLAGGTISIQSELGKGSCFVVELSFLIDSGVKTELSVQSMLIISHDDRFIENVKVAISEMDIILYNVTSKDEAEKLLSNTSVDLILVDSYTGDEVLLDCVQRLKQMKKNALLFFCCNYENKEQLSNIKESGDIDGVLIRPVFLSDLVYALNNVHAKKNKEETKSVSFLNGKRFLCAEDNALNAEILDALLDMNGATCVIYPDGQKIVDAFTNVKPGDFDAILMDMQMPVMDGLDATKAIRNSKNPFGKTIPIIAMTANAFSEDVQQCLDAGMDAHIAKPIDINMLENVLCTFLPGERQKIE